MEDSFGKMEAGKNVHEDVLIWHLKVIKVESPDHVNNIMVSFGEVWSNRDKPVSTDEGAEAGTMNFIQISWHNDLIKFLICSLCTP